MGTSNEVKLLNLLESQASAFGTQETADLEPYNLYLSPGEKLTFSSSSTNVSSMSVAINWYEDN